MADLITTRTSELAWGQDGRQVKRATGGRPGPVWWKGGALKLDINATMAEPRQVVPGPGPYRLYPIDEEPA